MTESQKSEKSEEMRDAPGPMPQRGRKDAYPGPSVWTRIVDGEPVRELRDAEGRIFSNKKSEKMSDAPDPTRQRGRKDADPGPRVWTRIVDGEPVRELRDAEGRILAKKK